MKPENKELLLKDLYARLPYGVKVYFKGEIALLFSVNPTQGFPITLDKTPTKGGGLINVSEEEIGEVKPYLRPISSMTEEEKKELGNMGTISVCKDENNDIVCMTKQDVEEVTYLFRHHYDVFGLIPAGLALSTDEFNPYKD